MSTDRMSGLLEYGDQLKFASLKKSVKVELSSTVCGSYRQTSLN